MKKLIIFCIFSITLFAQSVIVEGISAVVTSKIDAKNQAILDAKIRAIESTIGTYIKSQTQMENYEIKYDIVEQNIEGYVSRYKILEEHEDGSTYTVKIEAEVKEKLINNDIKNLLSVLNYNKKPKFVITTIGDSMVSSIFKSTIKNYFIKNDIEVINLSSISDNYKNLINLKDSNQLVPYKRLGIDYIINLDISRQNIDTNYKGQKHKSINLHISTDIVNTATFETIVNRVYPNKVSQNKLIIESDLIQSANDIAQSYTKNLLLDLIDKLNSDMYNGEKIKLNISGLKNYKSMQEFKDYLKEIVGSISSINNKQYSFKNTTFDITIKGGMSKFLDDFIMNNDKYTIDIKDQNSNVSTFNIINK